MKTLTETNQLLFKRIILIVYDIIAVVAASLLALFIRFEGRYIEIPREYISRSLQYIPVIIVITLIIFYGFRLYSSLWTYAGAPELINITFASALSAMVQMMVMVFFDVRMPRSYYILYGVSLWILVFLSRFSYRGIRTLIKRQANGENTSRVLLVGAGAAGNMLVKEIRNSNYVSKQVVCIVDDDKSKEGSYLHGVKVLGNRQNIPELVKRYRIDEIIIAMPSAPAKEIKEILDVCKETGCELKRLPGVYQLVNGEVGISKLKEVDVNDLLGREPVKVDLSTILNYVSGKTVLVTGGGGSIGSEICRQVAEHHPRMLVLVDIYENTTYDIQNELKNKSH